MDATSEGERSPMKNRATVERKSDKELVITRTVDGPARIVFEAWTNTELFVRWWVPESFGITLRDGPFRHLHGEWSFRALADEACKVELGLAYEFKTHMVEAVDGPVFNHIAHTFIDAFARRADAVYGKS